MATILLSAAGAAAGSAFGGSVLGLSAAVAGRAVGATLGRVLDQKLLGNGSQVVEAGKVERFRLTGASEGAPMAQVFGRMRLGGQIIWATQFQETITSSGGGKGAPSAPKTRSYSYSVSVAIALCEGPITRVGRVWADGVELSRDSLNFRIYTGAEDQMPDPKIAAVEGVENAPSYRGVAYVVIEDLDLDRFGNRVPQFSFEVVRAPKTLTGTQSVSEVVKAVALMPGTGEYALATSSVHQARDIGETVAVNVNSPSGKSDLATSLEQLREEIPECESTSLIVSWFGDDLRCGHCQLMPKVEQSALDGEEMPWQVSGLTRSTAPVIAQKDGRVIYGGTPSDASVREAIVALKTDGKRVMFYPFILMEQLAGNGLADPWGGSEQPELPWRGRITSSLAAGQSGSPDGTSAAEVEVSQFFGAAQVDDFSIVGDEVVYTGPAENSYRRFILHYAHLCAQAGGVEAFCIGSEMRGLSQIRGDANSFPAVQALVALAGDVRAILGSETKISYAADWSEYFGYHPQDGSGDVFFNLDELWADANIDFIGIDNYMPMSDWRDGVDHLDAAFGTIYNLDYLSSNIEGGEGYDWFYASDADRDAQNRSAISDGAYGEPWVYRYKDIRNWWNQMHHNRIGGVRNVQPTSWTPQSKPIWFTELGCAAIDKGTNQPNKFLDPKSSESALPYGSNGHRDDLIQSQYLRAITGYWEEVEHNPVSAVYGGPMLDINNAHVWAWDARPYPHFPLSRDLWSDGENYSRGHWLNGRVGEASLAGVIHEICSRAGISADVSGLYGSVRGFMLDEVSDARSAIQPLMLTHGFDAMEREGEIVFRMRGLARVRQIDEGFVAVSPEADGDISLSRASHAEVSARVRLSYVEADRDFETRFSEATFPDGENQSVSQSEVPLSLTEGEGRIIAERWMSEARIARDTLRLALPLSRSDVDVGDVLEIEAGQFRVDAIEQGDRRLIEAVRVEAPVYMAPSPLEDTVLPPRPFPVTQPVTSLFLDLPMMTGEEVPHAPHLAITSKPWPGEIAVYSSSSDAGYRLNSVLNQQAQIGVTQTSLAKAPAGIWQGGTPLRVRIPSASLSSADREDVLNGANALAIGDPDTGVWEIMQFARVDLISADTFDLTDLLRGQQGTDGVMPNVWPSGSAVVLLDGAPSQIDMPMSARGLARHYRIGAASVPYDDHRVRHVVESFEGVGLRPYSPCHLKLQGRIPEELQLSWIRRTRLDGDSWASEDVPLGEAEELYRVQVLKNGTVVRESQTSDANWIYGVADQVADGITSPFTLAVAQLSDRYGAGPYARIEIND